MHICASKSIPKETLLMVAKYQEMHRVLSPNSNKKCWNTCSSVQFVAF